MNPEDYGFGADDKLVSTTFHDEPLAILIEWPSGGMKLFDRRGKHYNTDTQSIIERLN